MTDDEGVPSEEEQTIDLKLQRLEEEKRGDTSVARKQVDAQLKKPYDDLELEQDKTIAMNKGTDPDKTIAMDKQRTPTPEELEEEATYQQRTPVKPTKTSKEDHKKKDPVKGDFLDLEDRFEVLELLGTGGQGSVYLAQDHVLERQVAIKLLKNRSQEDLENLQKECRAAAKLKNEHVAKVYDLVKSHKYGKLFMVQEYFDGTPLKTFAKENKLSNREILTITEYLFKGLTAIHSKDLIHRDISHNNILIKRVPHSEGRGGLQAKIIDLGLSEQKKNKARNKLEGTLSFMSPETLKEKDVDVQSDIYSAGQVVRFLIQESDPRSQEEIDSIKEYVGSYNYKTERFEKPELLVLKEPKKKTLQKAAKKRLEERIKGFFNKWDELRARRDNVNIVLQCTKLDKENRTKEARDVIQHIIKRNNKLRVYELGITKGLPILVAVSAFGYLSTKYVNEANYLRLGTIEIEKGVEAQDLGNLGSAKEHFVNAEAEIERVWLGHHQARSQSLWEARRNYYHALIETGDYEKALDLEGRLDDVKPGSLSANEQLLSDALHAQTRQDLSTALAKLERLYKTAPNTGNARMLSNVLWEAGKKSTNKEKKESYSRRSLEVITSAITQLKEEITAEAFPTAEEELTLAQLFTERGWRHRSQGDKKAAINDYQTALDVAEKQGNHFLGAMILDSWGVAENAFGNPYKAIKLYDRALAALDKEKNEGVVNGVLAQARNHKGASLSLIGKKEEGLRQVREAIRIFESLGNKKDLGGALYNECEMLVGLGRLEEATTTLKKGLSTAQELHNEYLEALMLSLRGDVALQRGENNEAAKTYGAAWEKFGTGREDDYLAVYARARQAYALARQGATTAAQKALPDGFLDLVGCDNYNDGLAWSARTLADVNAGAENTVLQRRAREYDAVVKGVKGIPGVETRVEAVSALLNAQRGWTRTSRQRLANTKGLLKKGGLNAYESIDARLLVGQAYRTLAGKTRNDAIALELRRAGIDACLQAAELAREHGFEKLYAQAEELELKIRNKE